MISTKRFFAETGLICGLSVVLGLGLHVPLIRQFLAGAFVQGFVAGKSDPGIVLITLAEAEDRLASGQGVFVDSRSRPDFLAGHIPAAKNLPLEEADGKAIEDFLAGLPAGKAVIIYCSGDDCLASLDLAVLLRQQRLMQVRVFLGGWKEWTAAGLPVERGNDQE